MELSLEELERLLGMMSQGNAASSSKATRKSPSEESPPGKKKRKASAYSKRYGAAFKRLAPKFKKKNGQWKKDGFKRCAAAARKEAKR